MYTHTHTIHLNSSKHVRPITTQALQQLHISTSQHIPEQLNKFRKSQLPKSPHEASVQLNFENFRIAATQHHVPEQQIKSLKSWSATKITISTQCIADF